MTFRILDVPRVKQLENHCGSAVLSRALKYYSHDISQEDIAEYWGGKKHFEKKGVHSRGYFDTDGCIIFGKRFGLNNSELVRTRHCYPRIFLSTTSQNLANDLKRALSDLEINARYYVYLPKVKNEHIKYNFNINGIKNINKWLGVIGISNPI